MCTRVCTHAQTYARARTQICIHTHGHERVHTHTRGHTRARTHAHTHARAHTTTTQHHTAGPENGPIHTKRERKKMMTTTPSNQNIYAYMFSLSATCCFDQDDTETCRPLRRHEWRYIVFIDHHFPCNDVEITPREFQDEKQPQSSPRGEASSGRHGPAGPSFQPCSTVALTGPFRRPRVTKSSIVHVQVMSDMIPP